MNPSEKLREQAKICESSTLSIHGSHISVILREVADAIDVQRRQDFEAGIEAAWKSRALGTAITPRERTRAIDEAFAAYLASTGGANERHT